MVRRRHAPPPEGVAPRRGRPVHLRRPAAPPRDPAGPASGGSKQGRERFKELDGYRVDREWKRYEGTPQRDLFRELRARFLQRHLPPRGWTLDVGSGPGRFAPYLGLPGARRVLLDLSIRMLKEAVRRFSTAAPQEPAPDLVRGDAAHPPFKSNTFSEVVLLGNVIGFAESEAGPLLEGAIDLVAPMGLIVLETVVEAGEHSRYLRRLPVGAVRRLLAAPINAVRPRVEREGFRPEPEPSGDSKFRRMPEEEVRARFAAQGVETLEAMAVAPALGGDPERVSSIRLEPSAWRHLLELEEVLGRTAPRRARAAALLVAGRRTGNSSSRALPAPSPDGKAHD